MNVMMVGIGGFVGAVLRYSIGLIPVLRAWRFPVATLLVNFLGCVFIAFIAALAPQAPVLDERATLLLKVGLCGGFTTFSTFSLETVELLENGHVVAAMGYVALSVMVCLGAIYLGRFLARLLTA